MVAGDTGDDVVCYRWSSMMLAAILCGCGWSSYPVLSTGGDEPPPVSVAGLERSPGGPKIPLYDGFEGEAVADFWMPGNYGSGLYVPGAVATSKDYARTGARSVRITVKEGDIEQPGGDGKSTERAELDSGYFPLLGRDVWYGFSILVPEGFLIADVRLVLSSCKQRNNGTALIGQRYRNGRHELTVWEPGPDGGENSHYDLPNIRFGRWYDVVYHVRYSAGPDGRVEVWVDGKRVVSHRGANVDKDGENRFYNKIGLYRDRWKEPMTVYFDNYTLGDSYAAVDPSRFDEKR
jgi:Polysaccharide lyase